MIFPLLAVLRKRNMKLNLIFIVIDLFTIVAYPFVFLHGKLLRFSKARGRVPLANGLVTGSIMPEG
jgi:hypothetical protein